MTNMIQRAHRALTTPGDYHPTGGNIVAQLERMTPKLFIVPDALKIDPTDIETNIAAAAKENTAMNDRPDPLREQLRTNLKTAQDDLTARRQSVVDEQMKADAEFTASIDRLNDQIKSLTETHEGATQDFADRIADADTALHALAVGLAALPPVATASAPVPAAT